jgi:CheY-like chemotaxis protein
MSEMNLSIFYTDDDVEDQLMFIDAMHEVAKDVKVSTQANGDDLIRLLNSPPPQPSVIFLDLNMPVKNGFEVLKELRQLKQFNKVPVVIFTTSDHEAAIETTRRLGANLYVTKPLTYNLLKGVIRHVLSIDWANFTPSDGNFVYRGN